MVKCTGQKSDSSVCPQAGSCQSYNAYNASMIKQAPFTMVNGIFNCNDYSLMTEQNLGNSDFGNDSMLNS